MKMGRPALPEENVRWRALNVRLTSAEKMRVLEAAKRDRVPLSKWVRTALLNFTLPLDAALLEDDSKVNEARMVLREYVAETREAPLSEREAALLARLCDLMGVE